MANALPTGSLADEEAELAEIRARKLQALRAPKAPSPPPGPVAATVATFGPLVAESPHAVVDFWAEWCGPCRQLSPTLDALAAEFQGAIRVLKVNVDREPDLAARFEVQAIPTLLLLEHGRPIDRIVGALPTASLRERLVRSFRLELPRAGSP